MNRLDKTEHGISKLSGEVKTLWGVLIILFIVFSFGYIRLSSRLNSLEGSPRLIQSPVETNII